MNTVVLRSSELCFATQPMSGRNRTLRLPGGSSDGNNGGSDSDQTVPYYRFRRHGVHGAVCGGGGRSMRRRESRRQPPEMGRGREKPAAPGGSAAASRGEAGYVSPNHGHLRTEGPLPGAPGSGVVSSKLCFTP